MSLVDRAKALALPIRRSRIGSAAADTLLLAHGGRLGRSPALADLLHRVTVYDPAEPERRGRSVDALTELFFELVEGLGVRRFVEAGAKEGSASQRAAGIPGIDEVVAFEANPYTHRRFAPDHADTAVSYEHLALSDRAGPVTMHIRLRPDGKPSADGQSSLLVRPDHTPGYRTCEVPGVTLDERFGAPTGVPAAMWVDVEGATKTVLDGAPSLLRETEVVIVEVEERPAWTGQEWLRREVAEALAGHGLVPIGRDRQSRFQFNQVFVRRSRLGEPVVVRALRTHRRAVRGRTDGSAPP